jgi:hypothetical protein
MVGTDLDLLGISSADELRTSAEWGGIGSVPPSADVHVVG